MEKIAVILSTFNGERFLCEQIDSILNQKDVEVHLYIRDDGSTDSTPEILKEYQSEYSNINVYYDSNKGCKESFYICAVYALAEEDDTKYFAFADQDDYWMEDKLQVGIRKLKESINENAPKLYFCTPKIVDKDLNPLDIEWNNKHLLNFEEACLVQPCAGCTMIFNRRSLELFLKGFPKKMSLHDSWMYKCVLACGGYVVEDTESHIFYRQHGNNVVGTSSFSSRWKRRYNNFINKNRYRSIQIKYILDTYCNYMPPRTIESAKILSSYTEINLYQRIRLAFNPKFRLNSFMHNLMFKLAIISKRY